MWPERAQIETFQIRTLEEKTIAKIKKQLLKQSSQKILKKFNKKSELITIQSQVIEKEHLDPDLSWRPFSMSDPFIIEENEVTVLKRVGAIIPSTQKSLDEARGYIIADYQDYLEKEWIQSLQDEYKVQVNQEVLKKIIKE
jgi:peptidyl-prolyl cis-trans isomerase SurA